MLLFKDTKTSTKSMQKEKLSKHALFHLVGACPTIIALTP